MRCRPGRRRAELSIPTDSAQSRRAAAAAADLRPNRAERGCASAGSLCSGCAAPRAASTSVAQSARYSLRGRAAGDAAAALSRAGASAAAKLGAPPGRPPDAAAPARSTDGGAANAANAAATTTASSATECAAGPGSAGATSPFGADSAPATDAGAASAAPEAATDPAAEPCQRRRGSSIRGKKAGAEKGLARPISKMGRRRLGPDWGGLRIVLRPQLRNRSRRHIEPVAIWRKSGQTHRSRRSAQPQVGPAAEPRPPISQPAMTTIPETRLNQLVARWQTVQGALRKAPTRKPTCAYRVNLPNLIPSSPTSMP